MFGAAPVHRLVALGQQVLWLALVELKVPLLSHKGRMQGLQGVAPARLLASADGAASSHPDSVTNYGLPGVLVAALARCAQPPHSLLGATSDVCRIQALVLGGVPLGCQVWALLCQGESCTPQAFPGMCSCIALLAQAADAHSWCILSPHVRILGSQMALLNWCESRRLQSRAHASCKPTAPSLSSSLSQPVVSALHWPCGPSLLQCPGARQLSCCTGMASGRHRLGSLYCPEPCCVLQSATREGCHSCRPGTATRPGSESQATPQRASGCSQWDATAEPGLACWSAAGGLRSHSAASRYRSSCTDRQQVPLCYDTATQAGPQRCAVSRCHKHR